MFVVHGILSKALASARKPEKAHVTVLYLGQFQIMSIMFLRDTFRLDGRITVLLLDRIKSSTAWCDLLLNGEASGKFPRGDSPPTKWDVARRAPRADSPRPPSVRRGKAHEPMVSPQILEQTTSSPFTIDEPALDAGQSPLLR